MINNFERNEINCKIEVLAGFCHGAMTMAIDDHVGDSFNHIKNEIIKIYHLINKEKNPEIYMDFLSYSIEELDLSIMIKNSLLSENILTIGNLIEMTQEQLIKTPNLGYIAIKKIKQALEKYGLSLRVE